MTPAEQSRDLRFDQTVFAPKSARFCLVIPVINEGERIRAQLRNLAGLRPPVDVVIADGGSTDGSLDPEFLRQTHVRALLVKTSPGRLSAQLRMAYLWALSEGYDGVITVDGNGKDGLEAIPRFCERLAAGVDYVQGSRYLKGGAAVNTPTDRYFGGKLFAAPTVSLAAGRRFTDVTNGFRAYSRRLLEDPRVAPFRDVFSRYNLLFYLTIRAARLGFVCEEAPVSRAYPERGPTPTKISGLRGKIALAGEVLGAAFGRYDPPS